VEKNQNELMDFYGMQRAIARISHEIIEKNKGIQDVCIVGIQRRGVPISQLIADKIYEIEDVKLDIGYLDITFYRDDLSLLAEHPVVNNTELGFSINDKKIILVDDVLYTGRTVRAAIEAIMDLGRPKSIQLAVLIDRGHRELPIRADYVGKNVPTSKDEIVHVSIEPFDKENKVTISVYKELENKIK
jgi:pyrimidine operon attenuation protein/uracil phosphoribosyltransferase